MTKFVITEMLLTEIASFVCAVSQAEEENLLRPVIAKSSSQDGMYCAIAIALDRGETQGLRLYERSSGTIVLVTELVMDECPSQKCVFWLKDLDSLTVGISPVELYEEEMGDGQGKLLELSCD
jgi:hypothetical protein